MTDPTIEYRLNPDVTNDELSRLFADTWPDRQSDVDYSPILSQSLGYICAYHHNELIGFVNVAWDGAVHAFLLDPTVRSDMQRQGIGSELVRRVTELARSRGAEWLHVDYEATLADFYVKCGFVKTKAGLIHLR